MSVNWVMFAQGTSDFIRLPGESVLFTTPARVAFSLDSVNKFPGKKPYNLTSPSGKAWLTSKRLIYLPTTQPPSTSNNPSPLTLHSFSVPHSHIHDAHVTAPWFGPNAWVCAVQPVPGGGIPADAVELTLTFKEGGAYDFHTKICEIKERLAQMRDLYDVAEEVGGAGGGELHLEQLPAYEEVGGVQAPSQNAAPASAPGRPNAAGDVPPYAARTQSQTQAQAPPPPQQHVPITRTEGPAPPTRRPRPQQPQPAPDELPPAYDESAEPTQLARRLSELEDTEISSRGESTGVDRGGR